MKRLLPALLLLAALLGALPAAAQDGPTLFLPGVPPPAPPPLQGLAPPRAGLAQALSCRQALADPAVSASPAASPWRQLRGGRTFVTDVSFSAPQSMLLEEASASDVDSVGQTFGPVSDRLAEVAGALRFRYAPDSTGAGDRLRVAIYESASPDPVGLIFQAELAAADRDDGAWQSFEWEIRDEVALSQLRGRATAALVVSTLNAANGATQRLWLDDLTLDLCAPGGSIGGRVLQGGAGVPGAEILLVRSGQSGAQALASALTTVDGAFSFGGVPPLDAGASYRVWYVNRPAGAARDDSRLGFWAGPSIATFGEGATVAGLELPVDDVRLQEPAPNATVVATNARPARLSWGGRVGRPGERHRLCLYDPERADSATGLPAQLCGPPLDPARDPLAFSLAPASFAASPGFQLVYGRAYRWYVVVYGDSAAGADSPFGYSFYERAVTFAPELAPPPEPAPSLPPGDPAAPDTAGDWTLLVYVAADNALGDPTRATRTALPSAQLAGLSGVAAAHPGVRVLTYQDDLGDQGARLCAYPVGAPADCRSRPEPNTAAGQDLADFIAYGRARYPAARTALLIISPGSAIGLAPDESAGGGALSLPELRAAYAAAGLGGATRLDLVIYQASNLGNLHALAATAPYARYMVAPADQVWQLGAVGRIVAVLAGPGRADAAQAARGAVTAYDLTLSSAVPGRMFSMAAFDLGKVPAITQAVEDLAFVIRDEYRRERATLRPILQAARAGAVTYDSSGNGRHNQLVTPTGAVAAREDALVGLRSIAMRLRDAPGAPGPVRDEAADLISLLDQSATSPLLSTLQRSGQGIAGAPVTFDNATGLAIFFPGGDRLGGQPALIQAFLYGDSGPPRDTDWAAMLRLYLQEQIGEGPGGVTAAPGGGPQPLMSPGGLLRTGLHLPLLRR